MELSSVQDFAAYFVGSVSCTHLGRSHCLRRGTCETCSGVGALFPSALLSGSQHEFPC